MSEIAQGYFQSTSPTTFEIQFNIGQTFYCGTGILNFNTIPIFTVPVAMLSFDLPFITNLKPGDTVAAQFTGLVGATSIDITSAVGKSRITGILSEPIDAEYLALGHLEFKGIEINSTTKVPGTA